jgi:threonine dehydrogenase-like Zn-dependent dehydrogenase
VDMRSGSDLRAAVVGLGRMGLLHACILDVLPNVKVVGKALEGVEAVVRQAVLVDPRYSK